LRLAGSPRLPLHALFDDGSWQDGQFAVDSSPFRGLHTSTATSQVARTCRSTVMHTRKIQMSISGLIALSLFGPECLVSACTSPLLQVCVFEVAHCCLSALSIDAHEFSWWTMRMFFSPEAMSYSVPVTILRRGFFAGGFLLCVSISCLLWTVFGTATPPLESIWSASSAGSSALNIRGRCQIFPPIIADTDLGGFPRNS